MASINLPEELHARLAAEAEREGLTLDELLAAMLTQHVQVNTVTQDIEVVEGYDPAADPLARFAGIIETAEPGWIERHDAVFGGTYLSRQSQMDVAQPTCDTGNGSQNA